MKNILYTIILSLLFSSSVFAMLELIEKEKSKDKSTVKYEQHTADAEKEEQEELAVVELGADRDTKWFNGKSQTSLCKSRPGQRGAIRDPRNAHQYSDKNHLNAWKEYIKPSNANNIIARKHSKGGRYGGRSKHGIKYFRVWKNLCLLKLDTPELKANFLLGANGTESEFFEHMYCWDSEFHHDYNSAIEVVKKWYLSLFTEREWKEKIVNPPYNDYPYISIFQLNRALGEGMSKYGLSNTSRVWERFVRVNEIKIYPNTCIPSEYKLENKELQNKYKKWTALFTKEIQAEEKKKEDARLAPHKRIEIQAVKEKEIQAVKEKKEQKKIEKKKTSEERSLAESVEYLIEEDPATSLRTILELILVIVIIGFILTDLVKWGVGLAVKEDDEEDDE